MAEISDFVSDDYTIFFFLKILTSNISLILRYLSNKKLYIFISNYITTKDKYEINWNIRLCLIIMKAKTSIKGIS